MTKLGTRNPQRKGTEMSTAQRLQAKDLMQHDVCYVDASMTLVELATFLDDNKIHGAPVISTSGELVGVVSRTDLARAFTEGVREEPHLNWFRTLDDSGDFHGSSTDLDPNEIPGSDRAVSEVMSAEVVSVSQAASAGEVASMMLEQGVHRVLVIGEEERVVGILSATDLLKAIPNYEASVS